MSGGEEVLVICNQATERIGAALRDEAAEAGAEAVLAVMAERASHAGEPPAALAAAMAAADVVLAPTVQSLSHTAARKAASEAGARIATLPGRHRGDAGAGDERRHRDGFAAAVRRSPPPSTPARRPASPARWAATCGWGSRAAMRSPTPAS